MEKLPHPPPSVMRQHTKRGEICYEPSSGSGSQLIAGEQLGRKVYGMEISPAYCDVIVKRYLALGEGRRVLRNGEDVTELYTASSDGSD